MKLVLVLAVLLSSIGFAGTTTNAPHHHWFTKTTTVNHTVQHSKKTKYSKGFNKKPKKAKKSKTKNQSHSQVQSHVIPATKVKK
jgi:hypothetical protein